MSTLPSHALPIATVLAAPFACVSTFPLGFQYLASRKPRVEVQL